jgi:MFS family permease
MGVLFRKQGGDFRFTKIGKLAIISLIAAFSFSIVETIWAIYIDSFLHNASYVGFLTAFLTLISFFSYFFFIPLIEKTNKSKIYSISLVLFAVTYVLFAINTNFYFFVLLALLVTILQTLRVTSFGIIIKDKSPEKSLSKNEGLMYTFANISWAIGPLIAGFIAEKYNMNIVFILSSIFILIALLSFKISKINDPNIKKKPDYNLLKNFIEFFKDKDRVFAYFIGGGVNLWWVLIYLYIPLFIIRSNLSEIWIGYFLFAIAIPLILFEYMFGKLAGKIGFKKVFKVGYLIPCIIALSCFFVTNIFLILGLLIFASTGLAMLESTTEAYFFDVLKKKQGSRFYGPYNTTMDVNMFIGKIIPAIALIFLPFKSIFIIFSLFMLIFFFLSCKTKEVIERKR